MMILQHILIGFVAVLHIYIMYIEMYLWNTPKGWRIFGTAPEQAASSVVLAKNQGLYNGFLAAGLIWSRVYPDTNVGNHIAIFFLACVLVAGIYGAMTVHKKILFVQGGPALLALVVVLLNCNCG